MDLATLAMFAVIAVAAYFLLIRPQQKRAKEQAALLNAIEPGTRVMMSSGVYGTIRHVGDKQVVVEVSPGVEMTFVKQAIVRPLKDDEDEFEYDEVAPVQPGTEESVVTDEPVAETVESASDAVETAAADAAAEVPTVNESGTGEPPAKPADRG